MLDLVLSGGDVLTGELEPARRADVGVVGATIEAVGDLAAAPCRERVDARGLVVAPGFVDTHTHSDMACFLGPAHGDVIAAGVRQGVTTEVCGNCGFSPFPSLPGSAAPLRRHLATLFGPAQLDWHDLDGFAAAVGAAGLHGNLAPLVGHGSLRALVMGFDDRPARDEELAALRRELEVAFEQGALGLSSGLVYAPGRSAGRDELVELAGVAARRGRPYATHVRGETDMVGAAVAEALDVARASGAALHLSHHKAAGRANWGRTRETLDAVDRAHADGLDVTLDVYPYTAGSTLLSQCLPPWALAGGVEPMLARLAEPAQRERIRRDVAGGLPGWENLATAAGWDGIAIASCRAEPELEGATLAELARRAGAEPVDVLIDVVRAARGEATMIAHLLDEADVERVLRHPRATIGSDGIPLPGRPHPRWAGSFARVLGRYTREAGVLGLVEAVHKMTALAADRFGLARRGRIRAGHAADLVVFDAATVADRATFERPLEAPAGVRDVFVGGVAVVRSGELTGARPGEVLRAA